jgi:hypothetical protein
VDLNRLELLQARLGHSSSMRLPPHGVNRHHPNRLFARVIYAIPGGTIQDRHRLARPRRQLQQVEFSRPADRRAAVLNAGALVRERWWVFAGLRDVYPRIDLTSP